MGEEGRISAAACVKDNESVFEYLRASPYQSHKVLVGYEKDVFAAVGRDVVVGFQDLRVVGLNIETSGVWCDLLVSCFGQDRHEDGSCP
jgi:hypothetical protein